MPEKRKRKLPSQPVDPLALITRLGAQSQQLLSREIIAPLLPNGRIRTRVDGLIYEFKPRERFVGWGRFRPLNTTSAELVGEALPWERAAYLELFPALRAVLLWPDPAGRSPGTWLALPYNASDAQQRFGLKMEPFPVFLCDPTAGAERFERVIVRVDGRACWFDGSDLLADPTHAEWLRSAEQAEDGQDSLPGLASSERQALLFSRLRHLELNRMAEVQRLNRQHLRESLRDLRQRELARQTRLSLENQLRYELGKADAVLHNFSELVDAQGEVTQLLVEWSQRGQTHHYRSAIDPRLTVVSSGICLSGRDRDFDLTSLVSVMTTSPFPDYDEDDL